MKKFSKFFKGILLSLLSIFPIILVAQQGTVSGNIQDDLGPLIGATVQVAGTTTGTITDLDGNYQLSLDPGDYTLEISYIGYTGQRLPITVTAGGNTQQNFTLQEGVDIDEVVVLGTRASNRTNTDLAVPVDVISVSKLATAAPQTNLNQMMHYSVPSFSSNTQTISDGTDHIDPASLRGLGPDQVLVLINGKRRHTTSLVNVNGTFGRGNVGTDLNAIPADAIEAIEVLRDGAAAQYGSDAIAGVINLRLKDDVNKLRFSVNTGANFTKNASPQKDIDGEVLDIGVNYGLPLGETGGYVNLTGNFNFRGWTNRMQTFNGQIFNAYNSIERVAMDDGADLSNLSVEQIQDYAQQVDHFSGELKSGIANFNPDSLQVLQGLLGTDVTDAELAARGQERSDYNMRVGQSELRGGKFFANMAIPVGDDFEVYGFGGVSFRDGESGCFYRLPYQNRTFTPTYINGFLPIINSNIVDKSVAGGIRGMVKDWNVDFSNVFGRNSFAFNIKNTHNATLGNASPLSFDAGGHAFDQNTANLDISRYFEGVDIVGINVAFGAEYRFENFEVHQGSTTSYGNYDVNGNLVNSVTDGSLFVTDALGRGRPSGAQCFAGFLPSNDVDAKRNSIAGYTDFEFDISKAFMVGAALRFENYSDFGSTFNYKIASRFKVNNNIAVRAAHSTGFRAPSLHQIHFSRTSTIFVTENGVTTAQEVGVFPNTSRAAQLLGIPQLTQEVSRNYSAGITAKIPNANLKVTIDGYMIDIDDRIVLTGRFSPGEDPELQQIFSQAQANAAAFFANAINTRSQGIDVVLTHSMLLGGKYSLKNDLAAVFAQTFQRDDEINASPLLEEKGLVSTYFNEENRIYLEEAVPRTKITLNNTLDINKLSIYLRNTYFGETTEATDITALDPGVDFTYDGKVVTDLSLGYKVGNLGITIGANNLLDVYPDEADPTFQSSGRFIFSRRSPQFSYGGRHLFARLSFIL